MARPPHARARSGRRARSSDAPKLYAAVDLGTNNCRLLIAERTAAGGLRVVDSHSQIVRLGEGLARTGVLSDAAMVRAELASPVGLDPIPQGPQPAYSSWFAP